jgi:hypothetical protein
MMSNLGPAANGIIHREGWFVGVIGKSFTFDLIGEKQMDSDAFPERFSRLCRITKSRFETLKTQATV